MFPTTNRTLDITNPTNFYHDLLRLGHDPMSAADIVRRSFPGVAWNPPMTTPVNQPTSLIVSPPSAPSYIVNTGHGYSPRRLDMHQGSNSNRNRDDVTQDSDESAESYRYKFKINGVVYRGSKPHDFKRIYNHRGHATTAHITKVGNEYKINIEDAVLDLPPEDKMTREDVRLRRHVIAAYDAQEPVQPNAVRQVQPNPVQQVQPNPVQQVQPNPVQQVQPNPEVEVVQPNQVPRDQPRPGPHELNNGQYFTHVTVSQALGDVMTVIRGRNPSIHKINRTITDYEERQHWSTIQIPNQDEVPRYVANLAVNSRAMGTERRYDIIHEMLYRYMESKNVILNQNGKDEIRDMIRQRSRFQHPNRLFTPRSGWIGGNF